ncbi:MAG: hypothetical protein QXH80_02725 [Candidatus Nanoarchaeia archaeon]
MKNQEYEQKFKKSLELSLAARILKKAYLRSLNPSLNQEQLEKLLIEDILKRKESSWKLTIHKSPPS